MENLLVGTVRQYRRHMHCDVRGWESTNLGLLMSTNLCLLMSTNLCLLMCTNLCLLMSTATDRLVELRYNGLVLNEVRRCCADGLALRSVGRCPYNSWCECLSGSLHRRFYKHCSSICFLRCYNQCTCADADILFGCSGNHMEHPSCCSVTTACKPQ